MGQKGATSALRPGGASSQPLGRTLATVAETEAAVTAATARTDQPSLGPPLQAQCDQLSQGLRVIVAGPLPGL